VEFPVNELRQLGMKWGTNGGAAVGGIWSPAGRGNQSGLQIGIPNTSAAITSSTGGSSIPLPLGLNVLSGINLGLSAQLNLLAQDGKASILAEPQLSARNGAKATFLAGGEYPYAVSNLTGTTVQFKPYGVKLDITPRVDRNGVIRATVESEVSALDFSVTVGGGYPALTTRKTTTEFNVRNGETLVLAGMISRKSSTSIDKVPLLGDLPVLGALFRSKRFQNDETELVVFVTPTIVTAQTPGLVERVERAGLALEKSLGSKPYLSAPLQPGLDPARPDLMGPQTAPQFGPAVTKP
jgi:pilus assembly protein CpaC